MSRTNDVKNAKRIFDKIGKKKLTKEDKSAALRKHTNWSEEKIQKVIAEC